MYHHNLLHVYILQNRWRNISFAFLSDLIVAFYFFFLILFICSTFVVFYEIIWFYSSFIEESMFTPVICFAIGFASSRINQVGLRTVPKLSGLRNKDCPEIVRVKE